MLLSLGWLSDRREHIATACARLKDTDPRRLPPASACLPSALTY